MKNTFTPRNFAAPSLGVRIAFTQRCKQLKGSRKQVKHVTFVTFVYELKEKISISFEIYFIIFLARKKGIKLSISIPIS